MRKVIGEIFATLFLVLITMPALGRDCDRARQYLDKALNVEDPANLPLVLIKKEQLYKKAIQLHYAVGIILDSGFRRNDVTLDFQGIKFALYYYLSVSLRIIKSQSYNYLFYKEY